MRLLIRANGRPAPQGSHELGGAGQFRDSSPYLAAWRTAVKVAAYRAYLDAEIPHTSLPLFGRGEPVFIEQCSFIVDDAQCRAEGTDYPIGTPDVDKLLRGVLDALGGAHGSNARLYVDDSQVVLVNGLGKFRATLAQPRGAIIIVSDGRE